MRSSVFLVLAVLAGPGGHLRAQVSPASERRTVDRAARLLESGRLDEARAELTDLLTRAPASLDAVALLFELSQDSGAYASFLPYAEAAQDAAGGDSDSIRELWVKGLIGAGFADSALYVASRWVAAHPSSELAALSLASSHVARGDAGRGAEALCDAVDRGIHTLRVETTRADLLIGLDRVPDAAAVWASLLAFENPAVTEVADDLKGLPDPEVGLDLLIHELEGTGSAVAAGAFLALRLKDIEGSRGLATLVQGEGRPAFLREYVREADVAELPGEVAWAAHELILLSPRAVDKLRWRAMAADRSLVAGDTARARGELEALTRETRPGDGPHGAATQRLFQLLAADASRLDEASALLRRYAVEYPDSVRVRGVMYGQLAVGHARAGDLDRAERILQDARRALEPAALGRMDATGGRLSFWAGARDSTLVRSGRALVEAGLPAREQTGRIRLATVAQAADSSEIDIIGRAAYGFLRDPADFDPGPALRALAGTPESAGRSTILAYFGEIAAAAGRPDVAYGLRRRVLDRFPASAEAPGALLALARSAEPDEARRWLEQLIVGYPESALAPVARRLLVEMGEGGTRD